LYRFQYYICDGKISAVVDPSYPIVLNLDNGFWHVWHIKISVEKVSVEYLEGPELGFAKCGFAPDDEPIAIFK